MAKYQFYRLGGEVFEEMAQALLEKRRRGFGELIQFGKGADGSREATWVQPPEHPDYIRPSNAASNVAKHWVFQAKYHDIGLRGWRGAGDAVVKDLKSELEKLTIKHRVRCHHYVLITNVPLSGARRIGTRDKVTRVAEDWRHKIPQIEVWDAVDLSRMLDNNADVRAAYEELILPGDLIAAIYRQAQFHANRRENTFRGYLQYVVDNESKAHADEAGDEEQLPLSQIFVDQCLRIDKDAIPECYREVVDSWSLDPLLDSKTASIIPEDLDSVPSSFVLLVGALDKVMLLAGPGYGKSTITQYLALYHASRLVKPEFAISLAQRLKLPTGISPKDLDAFCEMRFPFRVELRRYAKWRKGANGEARPLSLATYIVRELIGMNVSSTLVEDDIFEMASRNPILLILDGLDEVPNRESRDEILKDCDAFLYRCSGENADVQVVMSSRPQGYNGEFDRFEPLRWRINDLSEKDFNEYCGAWLSERIKNAEDRVEAEERIKRGMQSPAVQRLATTLLQATVMLTIVRRKSDIPEERHRLFHKYVEVVFQREKSKSELIARYESELMRLHEIVGYRLHEAIGRGDDGSIPEARFKEFVREVWLLLRGDQRFEGIPNQECNNIVQLATNRLVFLSGKGEHQTDIDFVIQPYRKYFAAQYLNLHTEADPDKVFACLVERGAFWGNVLQFYVALANPAQQIAWVHRVTETDPNGTSVEVLLRRVEYRRATLATLPEYVRFTHQQFRRAVSIVFPPDEWWTWIQEDWAIPIVRTLRSGEARRELLRAAEQESPTNHASVMFSLWLFPQVISQADPEYQSFVALVRRLIGIPQYTNDAISIAVLHDLPIDLTSAYDEAAITAIKQFPYQRPLSSMAKKGSLQHRLSRTAVLRLLCSGGFQVRDMIGIKDPWTFLKLPVTADTKNVSDVDYDQESISISAPYWSKLRIEEDPRLPFEPSPEERIDPYEKYCLALFESLRAPADRDLDCKARALEKALPDATAWTMSSENVLGPSPDRFECDADWISYKKGVKAFFANEAQVKELKETLSTYQHPSHDGKHAWCALLFHPKHWNLLATYGLSSSEELEKLRECEWAKLMTIPKDFIELASFDSYRYSRVTKQGTIPLLSLLKVVIALHNQKQLNETGLLWEILWHSDVSGVTAAEIQEILQTVRDASTLPDSWAGFLISVGVLTTGTDRQMLSKLWCEMNRHKHLHLWTRVLTFPTGAENGAQVIKDLMEIGDDDSLGLAAAISLQFHELENGLSSALNAKIAGTLRARSDSGPKRMGLIRALLRSRSTVGEAELYGDTIWFRSVALELPHFISQAANKIAAMPQTLERPDFVRLRTSLQKLIEKSNEYPPEISKAALNALIQIDFASRKPLDESMWLLSEIR